MLIQQVIFWYFLFIFVSYIHYIWIHLLIFDCLFVDDTQVPMDEIHVLSDEMIVLVDDIAADGCALQGCAYAHPCLLVEKSKVGFHPQEVMYHPLELGFHPTAATVIEAQGL